MVPENSTAARIRVLKETFDDHTCNFTLYHATDKALKQQLLAACPEIFLTCIAHATLKFAQTIMRELLIHLWSTYRTLTPADVMAKNQELSTAWWHPPTPIEDLFETILEAKAYLFAGQTAISDILLIQAIYLNIEHTGLFTDACKKWRGLTNADNTLDSCITFFSGG